MQVDQPRLASKVILFQACTARTEARQVMCKSNVIFRTVPNIYQCERVRTSKSDAPGLPCMSLLSIQSNNSTDVNKLMYSYDAHFAVKCYKTGCTCLDAFRVIKYALMLAPAPKLLVQVVVSTESALKPL